MWNINRNDDNYGCDDEQERTLFSPTLTQIQALCPDSTCTAVGSNEGEIPDNNI